VAESDTSPEGAPPETLQRGAALGRYVVLDWLGGGGMGVVYAAYDPDLDRRVAIKLLRPDSAAGTEGRGRLLREAQAMARLAHPNVIAVYDVGTFGDQVFVAMEYVEGRTLKQWLADEPRTRAAVLQLFSEAGRGLAAAHACGLVHRDFKPDNVMVGQRDGRVRVLDFGLARAGASENAAPKGHADGAAGGLEPSQGSKSNRPLTETLTRTGSFIGTPGYMSPEQWHGQPTDARSDQFSFCVALYEALYSERPFQAPSVLMLAMEVVRGRVREPPAGSKVPPALRQVLLRGLRVERDQRYPSMDALLQALLRDPSTVRRRLIASAGVLGALAAIAAGGRFAVHQRSMMCRGAVQMLAGVWDGERRQAVRASFAATARPYAQSAFDGAARAIDEYLQGWTAMRQEACEATRLRGEQSEELLDLRMECLTERREEVRALVDVFDKADADVVANAVKAARTLRPLAECANVTALRSPVAPPGDPQTRARLEEVRTRLARATALRQAGKYADGLALVKAVAGDATGLGYRPAEADALVLQGTLEEDLGQLNEAEETAARAGALAEAAHHDQAAAEAWRQLVWVARAQGHYAEAHRWAQLAEAKGDRAGADPLERSHLYNAIGVLYDDEGKYDEALAAHRRALAIREKLLGPEHPQVAGSLNNLGDTLDDQGKHDEAVPYYRRALAIREATFGPEHPEVGASLNNLGDALAGAGHHEEALEAFGRALAIWEKTLGAAHPKTADLLDNIGSSLAAQGKFEEALGYNQRALAIKEKVLGANHPAAAFSLNTIGIALIGLKRYDRALVELRRALAIRSQALGADHFLCAAPLSGLGEALLALGRPTEAVVPLERALALLAPRHEDPGAAAEVRFALGRALWQAGKERERARLLATQARDAWMTAGAQQRKNLDAVQAWLAGAR
jgi:tetratricopeptide (TPR) repeat protein/predicted Ser/Thr protein kinase